MGDRRATELNHASKLHMRWHSIYNATAIKRSLNRHFTFHFSIYLRYFFAAFYTMSFKSPVILFHRPPYLKANKNIYLSSNLFQQVVFKFWLLYVVPLPSGDCTDSQDQLEKKH